jgi:hypothetical protein
MKIDRADIVAALRARQLDDRAAWVERDLPDLVDTDRNGALLRMLGIDLTTMSPVDAVARQH